MQFDNGNPAARPPRPILPLGGEDLIYDQIFKTYIRQDMFLESPSENASVVSVCGTAQSPQASGNPKEHHTALELIGSHELTWHPQEQGHLPSGELGESAEQQVPQFPDVYPHQQDDYLQDQENSSLQFAGNAGIAMTYTNIQSIPDSYEQFFTSLNPPDAPTQVRPVPTNTDISTPDAYLNDHLDQGISSFQSAQSAGIAIANANIPPNIPDSHEQFFTSLGFENAQVQAQLAPSNTNISTLDAYPEQQDVQVHLPPIPADQGHNLFQFTQNTGVAMANINPRNIPNSYQQPFTSLEPPNAPAQAQQPSDTDAFTIEQFQTFCASLNSQGREYITAFLAGAAAMMQTRVSNNPEINGVSTLTAQPGGETVYQSNSWNQTAHNPMPMANLANQSQGEQWNQTVNTHMPMTHPAIQPQGEWQWNQGANTHIQMAPLAIQSQMHSGYNAVQVQAQMQMLNQTPFIPNRVVPRPPNYQSQQTASKPAAAEYMEKFYGITIRPQDYGIFTQGQNPSNNQHKHNLNTASYGQHSQFVQGSSNDREAFPETAPMKRKREDEDEVLTPSRPPRRREMSSLGVVKE